MTAPKQIEYTELDVWKKARALVKSIYEATRNFPDIEKFGLTSQMRRSAISIPSNIAEGCGRLSFKESLQFLNIARGSTYELETQVYLAVDLSYLSEADGRSVIIQITDCKKLINGFIKYYRKNLPLNSTNN